ncbi:uncharacterized protein LY89DRAFT_662733 [Mollisia scopiformis]|uniref:Uncharacterized protein n=1 Tax=Mollisia scopiformis TaxID=149040 RepID=A0A194XUR8_MOLSC|nr:uncharacterized protein LY89DRAFT_662733 [Mollisia scopiformis]KUJ23953.1 hypothetical protein LY89DRAFT_662733 [Mollisia scopiformis]
MKINLFPAIVLLFAVTNVSNGRSIPKDKLLRERQIDQLDAFKEVRDLSGITIYDPLEVVNYHVKRIEPIEGGEGAGDGAGESGGGEGSSTSNPPAGESGANEGAGASETGDNTESGGGEEASSTTPADTAPPPPAPVRVVAPMPAGLGPDELTLWNSLTNDPLQFADTDQLILWEGTAAYEALNEFKQALSAQNPGIAFKDSFASIESSNWDDYFEIYEESSSYEDWKETSILSIKYAELLANRPQQVHVLYSVADGNHLPDLRFLSFAEMPIVTAPGSSIPQMIRWEASTYQQNIANANPNVIWTNGDAQLSTPMADITNDPQLSDESLTLGGLQQIEGGGPAQRYRRWLR